MKRPLATQFIVIGTLAAVVPLITYGFVSIRTLRAGTHASVVSGLERVVARTADQLDQWFTRTSETLLAVDAELQGTRLARWQQERVLRNYVLSFAEIRSMTLFDADGVPLVSSHLSLDGLILPHVNRRNDRGIGIAPTALDDALLPNTAVTLHAGDGLDRDHLVAELHLEQMWRVVDRVRVGEQGFALLADESGRLIAHGDPRQKVRIARGEDVRAHPLAARLLAAPTSIPLSMEHTDASGQRWLSVGVTLPSLQWLVMVEQPASEAFAVADRLRGQLLAAIAVALVVMLVAGLFWGRLFITPIASLMRATDAFAAGRLDTRVDLGRHDEFQRLGDAFNTMGSRLEALQEQTRRQERQAMFGRIAAGLAHDLAHPIRNLSNSCRLILKMHDDAEYRETFRRTVEREIGVATRVLDDLKDVGRPVPIERHPLDVVRSLRDVVESMRGVAASHGLSFDLVERVSPPAMVDADVFALGRVWRNLITNAFQATPRGGTVRVIVDVDEASSDVTVAVEDTGIGIAPDSLTAIFEDFVTTRRHGLGMGLAICRRIVEQLGGTLSVDSVVDTGSTFTVRLPRSGFSATHDATDEEGARSTATLDAREGRGERHGAG